MKVTPEEKQIRHIAAKSRRKEYDRRRMAAKRAAEKINPPVMTEERLAAQVRRRERDRIRMAKYYVDRQAAKVPKPPKPKPIVIAKPRPAPAYHRWSPETEAVNPNNVPVTRLPTPPARFHVEAPSDGFAAEWRRLRA